MRPGDSVHWALAPLAVLVFMALGGGASHAQERMTLEAAVRRAIEQSPAVIEAEANVEAARAIRGGATLLLQDNPEVEFSAGSRNIADAEHSEYEMRIAQALDVTGRRAARKDAATAALAAAQARLAERKAAVAAEVRQGFGHALAAERQEELADDALALASKALGAAEERYGAGSASLIELNTARVEVGKSKRLRLAAERTRAAAIASLRLLLGMSPQDELSLEGALPSEIDERALNVDELVGRAWEQRADLVALRHDLDAAKGEQRLAAREAVSLPKVGASYAREEDAKILQGFVSWDLPIFNRNQAARAFTGVRVRQLETSVTTLERQVAQEVELAVNHLRIAQETLDGFAGTDLAALDENVALTTEGYEAGQIDFLQLLLVRREMLEVRSNYIDALDDLNSAEAELDRVLGRVTGVVPGD